MFPKSDEVAGMNWRQIYYLLGVFADGWEPLLQRWADGAPPPCEM